jgi:Holliday junction resolvase-like predicted endonuclease
VLQKLYKTSPRIKKILGTYGEDLAAELIMNKLGYKFACRNLRTEFGEVDLVFKGGSSLLLVEVKFDTINKSGRDLWSLQQRRRFFKSVFKIKKESGLKVLRGFAIVKPKKFIFNIV